MIRVLQCVNNMHRAGLETVLMNYYRNIDRTKIQFDFLTHRPQRDDYDDEIEALGGRIYRAPRLYPQNYPAYFQFMKQLFAANPQYQIVHSHIDTMSYLPLLAAKKAGVPIRIAHSHSTGLDKDLKYPMKQFFRYRLPTVASHFLACGEQAGQFLHRDNPFTVMPNAVDASAYRYDPQLREKMRKELNLEDRLVIGHAGRFSYPKNHEFLLDTFHAVLKKRPDALLLLAGKGELEQKIREKVGALRMGNNVRFLGSRSDLPAIYQALDVLVMPSHYEGIPMVGVEAQFAGLPCIFSDRIAGETVFTDQCRFLSLEKSADEWASTILQAAGKRYPEIGDNEKYDIRYAAKLLEQYYEARMNQNGNFEKISEKEKAVLR